MFSALAGAFPFLVQLFILTMTTATAQGGLTSSQFLNLVCAIADDGDRLRYIIEDYLAGMADDEVLEVYDHYFKD